MPTPFLVLLGAAAAALSLTPLVEAWSRRLGFIDRPGVRKVHERATPLLGGVAILVAAALATACGLWLTPGLRESLPGFASPVAIAWSGSVAMAALGAWDDIRGMRARTKLLAQVLVATGVALAGVRLDGIGFGPDTAIEFGWLAVPISVFVLVGLTNAVNLIDGMDGLATGIGALSTAVIALLAWQSGQLIAATALLAVTGALLGFLAFNYHPARIFLGDSGSLFLGFMIASSVLAAAAAPGGGATPQFDVLAIALISLSVPILDTCFAMLRRFLERRSIFAPDRNHLHHRLLRRGLGQREAAVSIYAYAAIPTGCALVMLAIDSVALEVLIVAAILVGQTAIFRHWGAVRLKESWRALRRKQGIAWATDQERRQFEATELGFREADTFEQWWLVVQQAANRLGLDHAELTLSSLDGEDRPRHWTREGSVAANTDALVRLPIPQHPALPPANLAVRVAADSGQLESVGRRITWLSRLLDAYPIEALPEMQRQRRAETRDGESVHITGA